MAAEVGLYGSDRRSRRRLVRVGNSTAVTIDPSLLGEVLPGLKAGSEVWVGRLGKRIVIEAAD